MKTICKLATVLFLIISSLALQACKAKKDTAINIAESAKAELKTELSSQSELSFGETVVYRPQIFIHDTVTNEKILFSNTPIAPLIKGSLFNADSIVFKYTALNSEDCLREAADVDCAHVENVNVKSKKDMPISTKILICVVSLFGIYAFAKYVLRLV